MKNTATQGSWIPAFAGLVLSVAPFASRADNFRYVSYDPGTDELVIGVIYQGTNPDHQFSLQWGSCHTLEDGHREIVGDLLDQQSQDAAQTEFRKTLRFSLAHLDCRPATVTIRTPPRFFYTLQLPRPPSPVKTPPEAG